MMVDFVRKLIEISKQAVDALPMSQPNTRRFVFAYHEQPLNNEKKDIVTERRREENWLPNSNNNILTLDRKSIVTNEAVNGDFLNFSCLLTRK
jgi:hypothetical protein